MRTRADRGTREKSTGAVLVDDFRICDARSAGSAGSAAWCSR